MIPSTGPAMTMSSAVVEETLKSMVLTDVTQFTATPETMRSQVPMEMTGFMVVKEKISFSAEMEMTKSTAMLVMMS